MRLYLAWYVIGYQDPESNDELLTVATSSDKARLACERHYGGRLDWFTQASMENRGVYHFANPYSGAGANQYSINECDLDTMLDSKNWGEKL